MAKYNVARLVLLTGLLVGSTVQTLFTVTDAAARVAITAAKEGDPLGRPPGGADRDPDPKCREACPTGPEQQPLPPERLLLPGFIPILQRHTGPMHHSPTMSVGMP